MKLLVGFDNKIYPGVNEFKSIGTCKFINYNQISILEHIGSCNIFIPHLREPINKKILKHAKKLKIIATDNILDVLKESLVKTLTPIKWKEEDLVLDNSIKNSNNKGLVRH